MDWRERLARALCEHFGKHPDELVQHPASKSWEPPSMPAWEGWTAEIDAILACIEQAGYYIATRPGKGRHPEGEELEWARDVAKRKNLP